MGGSLVKRPVRLNVPRVPEGCRGRMGRESVRGKGGVQCPKETQVWCGGRRNAACECSAGRVGKRVAGGRPCGGCKKGWRRGVQEGMGNLCAIKWLPGNAPNKQSVVQLGQVIGGVGGWRSGGNGGWAARRQRTPSSGGPYLTPWERERGWECNGERCLLPTAGPRGQELLRGGKQMKCKVQCLFGFGSEAGKKSAGDGSSSRVIARPRRGVGSLRI